MRHIPSFTNNLCIFFLYLNVGQQNNGQTQRLKLLQKIIESHDNEIGGNLLLSGSTDI